MRRDLGPGDSFPVARDSAEGQAADIEISARRIIKMREVLNKMLAKNTGQTLAKIEKDVDRDYFMDADEAKKYGIIDQVVTATKK